MITGADKIASSVNEKLISVPRLSQLDDTRIGEPGMRG